MNTPNPFPLISPAALAASKQWLHAAFILSTSVVLLHGSSAKAATLTWNSSIDANFNTAANWVTNGATATAAPTTGDYVIIGSASLANPNLSSSASIAEVTFSSSASGYTISGSQGTTLTLNNGIGTIVSNASTTGTNTVSSNIKLGIAANNAASIQTATGAVLVLSGNISETNAYTALTLSKISGNMGTVVLSGSNSFSGGVSFTNSSGTLRINNQYALGSGTLTLGTNNDTLDNTSGTAITVANTLLLSSASGNGATFTNTYGLSFNGPVILSGAGNNSNVQMVAIGSGTTTFGGGVKESGGVHGLQKNGIGTLILTANATYTGTTTISAGTLQLGDGTTGHDATISGTNIVNYGTLVFDTAGTPAASLNNISGTGNVIKTGVGVQVLSGSNTYTGSTTISNGTLQLGDGGTTGSLSVSSAIVNNGNLAIKRSNAVAQGTDFSGAAITGTGSFTQAGSGTTTLTAVNTYTGATNILAGELAVNGSLAAGSAVNITGATLSGNGTVKGSVTGTNATINGNNLSLQGTTVLDGTSRFTGTTSASSVTVNSGTTANLGTTIASGALTVKAGATLNNTGSASASSVTVEHTASLKNDGTLAATAINVTGVLTGTGTITGALTIKANGELAPGNSPGTQTVQGSLTVETGAKVSMQLESLSSFDKIIVSNGVTLAGTLALDLSDAFLAAAGALTSGTSLTLIDNTSANAIGTTFENITYTTSSGTYTATGNAFTVGNVTYGITYTGGDNNDLALIVSVVPEPSTWAILFSGLTTLVGIQRFRRSGTLG